jgi:superfamily II RNA helicase
VTNFKGYTLNPFQEEAVEALSRGHNLLLSAPTGAGKTLVAEWAIDAARRAGRRAIYTAPIKALSNQKYRDFKADGLDVGLMTGDLTLHAGAQVLIMTTEIFRNAVFEDPERFDDVDTVVFDEIHFLDDPERGTVWEESLIFAPPHVRFVGLSATIANLDQFGEWLASIREQPLAVIRHDERPVPLDQQLFHRDTGLFRIAQRKRAIQVMKRLADKHQHVHAGDGRKGKGRGRGFERARGPDRRRERRHERRDRSGRDRARARPGHTDPLVVRHLLDHLTRQQLTPILYFCFSRKECEIKASRNTHRTLLNRAQSQEIEKLFREICAMFELDPDGPDPALQGIGMRAARGIGFHHAGMLPIHKEVVERLFTSGLLRLLFTTETFALGINMPARTVVFDSLRKYDGVKFDYMAVRDYMQMAGRAGRQGIDDAGLVVSIVDDEALVEAPLPKLFSGQAEAVRSNFNLGYSTILNLWERTGMRLLEAYDRSFACFLAGVGGSRSSRAARREAARSLLRARIDVLRMAGYIGEEREILPRGKIAQQINGYEIQTTELLMSGVLDDLAPDELAALFTSVVHESRRAAEARREVGRAAVGALARQSEQALNRFAAIEAGHGFESVIKRPDWALAPAVLAWARGCDITELESRAGTDAGDVVRTMRMAIQMMRQMRGALSGDYELIPRLEAAIVAINRDEVDAKRQFELG